MGSVEKVWMEGRGRGGKKRKVRQIVKEEGKGNTEISKISETKPS